MGSRKCVLDFLVPIFLSDAHSVASSRVSGPPLCPSVTSVVKKNCPQEDRTTWLRSRREKTGNNSDAARSTFDGEFSNEDSLTSSLLATGMAAKEPVTLSSAKSFDLSLHLGCDLGTKGQVCCRSRALRERNDASEE